MAELESEILDMIHRRIVRDFLDMLILMELRKRSMGGHDVIAFVHNKFGMLMSTGTVYSHLYFLERNRLIKGESTKRKRVYNLTERGNETVKTFLNAKDKILGLILNLFVGE